MLAPAAVCGLVLLLATRRRALCFIALVAATLLSVLMIVSCALEGFAGRESVAYLLRQADAQGHAGLPVYQLHTLERSAEFYAAGRLPYDETGRPVKFEGAWQAVQAARQHGGRALVLVPVEYVGQLTGEPSVESHVLGDNGAHALVHISTKN